MITKTWAREDDLSGRPACVCTKCHRPLVHVLEVGWLDPEPGGPYDVCPADLWGNHSPDLSQVHRFRPRIP